MLENQLKFFNNSTLQDDPLVISDQYIEDTVEAAAIFIIIDADKDEGNIKLHSYDSLSKFKVCCNYCYFFKWKSIG